jgi:hypothetical protein
MRKKGLHGNAMNRSVYGRRVKVMLMVTLGMAFLLCTGVATAVATTAPPAFLMKWGSYGTGDGQFGGIQKEGDTSPFGVAVDAAGNVYVADGNNYRIEKFSPAGTFLAKWGTEGSGDGQFEGPDGIAVDNSGSVYVADPVNNCIQKFSSTGTFLLKWGTSGSGDGQFSWASAVAADRWGNVYVVDAMNYRIEKFSSTGTFLAKWGTEGSGDGQFADAESVAVDSGGNVFVTDGINNCIQKFSSTGTFLSKWGTSGSGDGQFYCANGITIDTADNIYVAEGWANYRVQEFSPTGTFLTKWGSAGSGNGQFDEDYISGIAADSNGNVYVAGAGNIQKFGSAAPASTPQPVWRFRNLKNGFYLWSADPNEKTTIINTLSGTWFYEGPAYTINTSNPLNSSTLWRFRNTRGGFYLYTADPGEKANIINTLGGTWTYEGPAYNVSMSSSGAPVWRFRNLHDGTYLYSADPNEKNTIVATLGRTWFLEGVAYYIAP